MHQDATLTPHADDADAVRLHGWRPWLVPAFLLLLVLAPLLREGIPATQVGLLPLFPALREAVGGPRMLGGGALAYKVQLALPVVAGAVASGAIALAAFGRRTPAWWIASMWLLQPYTLILLYRAGQPGLLWQVVAFFVLNLALYATGHKRLQTPVGLLVIVLVLGGALLFATGPALGNEVPATVSAILSAPWPDPGSQRQWLGAGTYYQLGTIYVVLLTLIALLTPSGRIPSLINAVLWVLGAAVVLFSILFTTGSTEHNAQPYWNVYSVIFTIAIARLPTLDRRYARLPFLLGTVILATLLAYPALSVAWHAPERYEGLSGGAAESGGLLLLEARASQRGDEVALETLWQAQGADEDYTAFVQFLDAQGQQVAQADALLRDEEEVPASGWPQGYLVRQRFATTSTVPVAQVRFGLYTLDERGSFRRPLVWMVGPALPGARTLEEQNGLLLPVTQEPAP